MFNEKISSFLRTGVAVATPPAPQYTSRTLPALARGIGGSVEDVLAGLKEDPSSYAVRLGRRGDIYVSLAD